MKCYKVYKRALPPLLLGNTTALISSPIKSGRNQNSTLGFETKPTISQVVKSIRKDNPTNYDFQFSSSSTPSKPPRKHSVIDLDVKTSQKDYDDDDESSYDWSSGADEKLLRILKKSQGLPSSGTQVIKNKLKKKDAK